MRLVSRIEPTRKAAFCPPLERPTVKEHFDTLSCQGQIPIGITQITIVDDILTQGHTTMACYQHLKLAFPDADIKIFTFVRTNSRELCKETFVLPRESELRYFSRTGKTFMEG